MWFSSYSLVLYNKQLFFGGGGGGGGGPLGIDMFIASIVEHFLRSIRFINNSLYLILRKKCSTMDAINTN